MEEQQLRLTFVADLDDALKSRYNTFETLAAQQLQYLKNGNCRGADFLGWYDLPKKLNQQGNQEVEDILTLAKEFTRYDVVVVIGIGGSYLGALALLEALDDQRITPHTELLFLGFTLCADYMSAQLQKLQDKKYAVVIISKSGTTTEPAIAFRYILDAMSRSREGYFPERIVAITDANRGTLHDLAVKEKIRRFVIPDNVGGRFSVFTPVGLLPLAIAGIDIRQLIAGAAAACDNYANPDLRENIAIQYAAWRLVWYTSKRDIEVLALYSPYMRSIGEWYKQLYGESEGKNRGGLFPVSVCNTTDLHSLGQYFQEGMRLFLETHVIFDQTLAQIPIPTLEGIADGMDYLLGKGLHDVNRAAAEATAAAHQASGIPNAFIHVPLRTPYWLGYLLYFWEVSCVLGVLVQGNNPFDQPGVEHYKKNMFHLLGKPGF